MEEGDEDGHYQENDDIEQDFIDSYFDDWRKDAKPEYKDRSTVTLDLHLNSPITDDDIRFFFKYKEGSFFCLRHKKIQSYFLAYEESDKDILPYYDLKQCPWKFLEDVIKGIDFPRKIIRAAHRNTNLEYLIETAALNVRIHHQAYYSGELELDNYLNELKLLGGNQELKSLYSLKIKVERIKEFLGSQTHILGHHAYVHDHFRVEKEISTLSLDGKTYYVFPTSMLMCVMDNLQSQFYVYLHILYKQNIEGNPGLVEHYKSLDNLLRYLRANLGQEFFLIMKDWDAFCIGNIVKDENDLKFDKLYNSVLDEWAQIIHDVSTLQKLVDLFTCADIDCSNELRFKMSLYFCNLNKLYGHPILQPEDGIKVIRENTKKEIDVDPILAKKTLWLFRKEFIINFYKKRGHYPCLEIEPDDRGELLLHRILKEDRLPSKKEEEQIPLGDWSTVSLTQNFSLNYEIDEKEILKDTACSPARYDWFVPYDRCAFKLLYNQNKPKSSGTYEPRVLARYLKGEPQELAQKVQELQRYHFNHQRDDIVQLCRKEQELNPNGRCYCKQTYLQRMLQALLEKALADNILPFLKDQTMTDSELEVTKKMDRIASSIGKSGHCNLNLDLSKWNQLQREELNRYIFMELDSLHGIRNCYADSHRWFNRCMVLLNGRLTPPKISPSGEPYEGPYCHYNQYGGFEGMRQKAWTITTIMIIKLSLNQTNIKGNIMGQGDNQVIHVEFNDEQNYCPESTINMLLNTLDHNFNSGGLKLKLSETWYSKYLYEYSKVRFYKGDRIDDSLKRLRRLISDINEGFPSLNSHLTTASTCTENVSRNSITPILPFFLYSLEAGNILSRKNMINPKKDKIALIAYLNSPNIFGGLPVSNIFQHAQRGWSDPITVWLKILRTIRQDYRDVYKRILRTIPVTKKDDVDAISLVEDMYSLNISRLPNFEREARDIVERKLQVYVTNPKIRKCLSSTRDDLKDLCKELITMRPYVANLAHEILKNSNEGIKLQMIGSFTNVATINKLILEDNYESEETVFHLGMKRDQEAIKILKNRQKLTKDNDHRMDAHLIETAFNISNCTYQGALFLRQYTWGFEIHGITSPIPSEQFAINDYDNLSPEAARQCIVAKTSEKLQQEGSLALRSRGPYPPYFGSPTSDKVLRPKLSVINPNEETKAIKRLFYIYSFLSRINPDTNILKLIERLIDEKLMCLPQIFREVPLEDWCGKNYGGSYEHRFRAASQKRSALYSLKNTSATHINMNTNLMGQMLRGDEDYNIFFQEVFLFIQNYITELASLHYIIRDTYGITINCPGCTHKIIPFAIDIKGNYCPGVAPVSRSDVASLLIAPNKKDLKRVILALSLYIGRQIGSDNVNHASVHNTLTSEGLMKNRDDDTTLLASNLMTEFRKASLIYIIVGILQVNVQALRSLENQEDEFPQYTLIHFSYLLLNTERLDELLVLGKVTPTRHAETTQLKVVSRLVLRAICSIYLRLTVPLLLTSGLTFFNDDNVDRQRVFWLRFIVKASRIMNVIRYRRRRIFLLGKVGNGNVEDWWQRIDLDVKKGLPVVILPCDFKDSVTFWRDNCLDIPDQDLPLEFSIQMEPGVSSVMKKPEQNAQSLSLQVFNRESSETSVLDTHIICEYKPPLWSKWIHHGERMVGRISTSASKFLHVLNLLNIKFPDTQPMRVVTLAEGSGSILNLLLHYFPSAYGVYNTLQKDSVEVKINFLNVYPPSLVGDQCRLKDRLIGLYELNIGETDITKQRFINKLTETLDNSVSAGPVMIISIDAEEKQQISNCEKLSIYAPLASIYLDPSGYLINKMFIRGASDLQQIYNVLKENRMNAYVIKPYGSHIENNEIYLACHLNSSSPPNINYLGRTEILFRRLTPGNFGEESCVKSRHARLNYFSEVTRTSGIYLQNKPLKNFCLWWENWFTRYNVNEIGSWFFSFQHMYNLVCCLLSVDSNFQLYEKQSQRLLPSLYIKKSLISSLITLGLSIIQSKSQLEIVYILDTLSCVQLKPDIIPGKHATFRFSYVKPDQESESVIGVIGERMKDIMRALVTYLSNPDISQLKLPRYGIWDRHTKQEVFSSQTFSKLFRDIKNLKLNKLNGFLLYDESLRRDLLGKD